MAQIITFNDLIKINKDFKVKGQYPSEEYCRWLKEILDRNISDEMRLQVEERLRKLENDKDNNPFWFTTMDILHIEDYKGKVNKHTINSCAVLMREYSEIYELFINHFMKENK